MSYHAITMTGGSVAIMQTVGDATVEECLAKWRPEDRAKVVSHRPIDPVSVPQDRTFRNAWTDTGKAIEHDMDKAREIVRDRLRAERAPLLANLDVEFQRATETGDAVAIAGVIDEKQILRDVTDDPRIDAATTVDELKGLTLATLAPEPAVTIDGAKVG